MGTPIELFIAIALKFEAKSGNAFRIAGTNIFETKTHFRAKARPRNPTRSTHPCTNSQRKHCVKATYKAHRNHQTRSKSSNQNEQGDIYLRRKVTREAKREIKSESRRANPTSMPNMKTRRAKEHSKTMPEPTHEKKMNDQM